MKKIMTFLLADARMKFLSFGTGSPAGTYYFLGAGFASMVNKRLPGVRVTAESTAASLENATLISRGKMDMGLAAMGTLAKLKARGVDVSKIRLIAVGHTSDTHWIVRKDSAIQSISDFKGKRIGVGPAGSATLSLFSKEALVKGWGGSIKAIRFFNQKPSRPVRIKVSLRMSILTVCRRCGFAALQCRKSWSIKLSK